MPHPNQAVVVRHPEADVMVVLDPAVNYPADDLFVRTFPQFFTPIKDAERIVESVTVEAASAAPGEKRARARSK